MLLILAWPIYVMISWFSGQANIKQALMAHLANGTLRTHCADLVKTMGWSEYKQYRVLQACIRADMTHKMADTLMKESIERIHDSCGIGVGF
jgi:hypothetical protein